MMTPDIFRGKHVIVQGITGKHGSFHTERMLASGTHIVGGTSPNQSVTEVHGVPVFRTIREIQAQQPVDISVIFVPAAYAKAAIMEAIDAEVPLIICITENIPVHDMLYITAFSSLACITLASSLPRLPRRATLPSSAAVARSPTKQ